ncbi:hypothetical protein [Bradyrhizobium tropiciagri]|uniref:hypothetical protein n=1 Tax=Bradyrhizobium tropiciagri TaxID=312253 RepID=UPI00067C80BA|nr:hypothetical protein [Bradyrhizobium tropiciagri]
MPARTLSQVLVCCVAFAFFTPAHALTQEELTARLQSAGYTNIRDVKSTTEGVAVKATKNGKDVSLTVDSSGQVKERQ